MSTTCTAVWACSLRQRRRIAHGEQSETHGMDDPHPNHHTRNAVKAAQREAFEENQAKKAKEKKKKAASEAKGAAPAKPAKKQEKSGSDTEPDTKPDGTGEPKEKDAWA